TVTLEQFRSLESETDFSWVKSRNQQMQSFEKTLSSHSFLVFSIKIRFQALNRWKETSSLNLQIQGLQLLNTSTSISIEEPMMEFNLEWFLEPINTKTQGTKMTSLRPI